MIWLRLFDKNSDYLSTVMLDQATAYPPALRWAGRWFVSDAGKMIEAAAPSGLYVVVGATSDADAGAGAGAYDAPGDIAEPVGADVWLRLWEADGRWAGTVGVTQRDAWPAALLWGGRFFLLDSGTGRYAETAAMAAVDYPVMEGDDGSAPLDGVYDRIADIPTLGDTIAPDIFSDSIARFSGGRDLPPGDYQVAYVGGAMRYAPWLPWAINVYGIGFRIVHGGGEAQAPGDLGQYATQAECERANAGAFVAIAHTGGPIGMYLIDSPYDDNVPGNPPPTFGLIGPL